MTNSAKTNYTFHWLNEEQIPLANKFYRAHGFRGKARGNESCAVIRLANNDVIACAYLRQFDNFKLLSGVAVAAEFQGQGVARLLLTKMAKQFNIEVYTFPYQQLIAFYQSIGFVVKPKAPVEVLEVFNSYQKQGRKIELMVYQAKKYRR
jgi:GNAT superfamily N-acetyltransferase